MHRFNVPVAFLALASLMGPMSAQAGQRAASFQISLKIVARPPAPRVSQQSVPAASHNEPPLDVSNGQVVTEGRSGNQVMVITTTF